MPRDKGWQKTELDYPSVHKKLFMPDFAYHVSYIFHTIRNSFFFIKTLLLYTLFQSKNLLERHLVIADHAYTMKDLVQLSLESNSVVLPTYRDSLEVKVEEEAGRKLHYLVVRVPHISLFRLVPWSVLILLFHSCFIFNLIQNRN